MIGILLILLIITICLCGYLYHANQNLKKEISYYRENDRMKDELEESTNNPQK